MKVSRERKEAIVATCSGVREWVAEMDADLEKRVAAVSENASSLSQGFSIFVGALVVVFGIEVSPKPHNPSVTVAEWLIMGVGFLGMVATFVEQIRVPPLTRKKREVMRMELEAERRQDPLYVQARKIVNDVDSFVVSYDQYTASLGADTRGAAKVNARETGVRVLWDAAILKSATDIETELDAFIKQTESSQPSQPPSRRRVRRAKST